MQNNIDSTTVAGFGEEWSKFDQSKLGEKEHLEIFESYFGIFPWNLLSADATGFDLGCGSGRWAKLVASKVGTLICIDASDNALKVAERNLRNQTNCRFYCASVAEMPIADASMDFGYSLGVLHHIPNPFEGIRACTSKLKKGAPFLIYLYYAFDNRPAWFRLVWKISDILRRFVAKLPTGIKHFVAEIIASVVYFPLARAAFLLEKTGLDVSSFPLSVYRDKSFYTMRTDALDRFGTPLEYRFTRGQIKEMLTDAGLEEIRFSEETPFWCAVGIKS